MSAPEEPAPVRPAEDWEARWRGCVEALAAQGLRRRLRSVEGLAPGRLRLGGRTLLDFSSNDYLGLSQHPALVRRAQEYAARWGAGAGASRLVRGNLAPYDAIEEKLARGKGSEAALLFASGFQANATLLPALLDERVLGAPALVFGDRLNHASLHLGLRAAGVRQVRYRHNDLGHLEALLQAHAGERAARFIVTETVFSMDGDTSDVPALAALAERHGAFLFLDEAHATGVLGPGGYGLAAHLPLRHALVMGTFSKALGSFGAYVCCSAALRDYLVQRCGGLIYSTALPPAVLGAMDAALDLLPTLEEARRALQAAAAHVRGRLQEAGFDTGLSATHIIPLVLGEEERTLAAARALEEQGVLGVAIRPPTVPPGTSRLRLSLSAAHSDEDLERLLAAVRALPGGAG